MGARSTEEGSTAFENCQTSKVKQVVLPKIVADLAIFCLAFDKVKQVVLLCRIRRIPSVNGRFQRV